MLTDLDWIADGKPWPPEDKDEAARRAEHAKNRLLYNGDHEAVFPKLAAYLKDKEDDDKKIAIIIGLAKTATKEYLNFIIGEAPEIDAPTVYDLPDYEVLTDASRYGLGALEISQDRIVAISPENFYIIVEPGNIQQAYAYVIFATFKLLEGEGDKKKEHEYVKFTIHTKGQIQHVVYEITTSDSGLANVPGATSGSGKKLAGPLRVKDFEQFGYLDVDGEGKQATGVDDLLVVCINNVMTSDRYYGQSDYIPEIYSKLEALDLAYTQRAVVLRKFTHPRPMAGSSAFIFDHAKQKWVWKSEEAIILDAGEQPAQYLTWQAELGAVEAEIRDLYKQLLKDFSLTDDDDVNKAESGTAIKLKQSETLAKVRWLASEYQKKVPIIYSLKSKISKDASFEPDKVQVTLQDGIPDDPMETANRHNIQATALSTLTMARILSPKAALQAAYDAGIIQPLPDMTVADSIAQISEEAKEQIM